MKKFGILMISVVLVFVLVFVGCGDNKADQVGEVNGQPITTEEYESHLSFLRYFYEIQAGVELDEEKDKETIETLKTQTFDDLVLKKILYQQAEKENISIEDSVIDAEVENAKAKQGEQEFKKLLDEMGMSEKQLREQIKTEKLYSALQEKVTAEEAVTIEEVRQYYDENKDMYIEQGGMELAHILVDTEEKAREILAKLEQGDDFASLAKEFSSCPSSSQGGDLGLINEDSNFVEEFKTAALKLKPGETTDEPVKSEFGYHIIKAGKLKEARTIPFEEVEKELQTQLRDNKKAEMFYNYLQDLHKKADIVDLRKDNKENNPADKAE